MSRRPAAVPKPLRGPLSVLNRHIPPAVLALTSDPARLCPMLAGASCMKPQRKGEGLLVVRATGADVEVRAPMVLLDQVFKWCDGTRTVEEVLALIAKESERVEFEAFIQFLLGQGALIDSNLACAQAVQYGFQFSPFGLSAPAKLTHQICARFLWNPEKASEQLPAHSIAVPSAPLAEWFDKRVTQYTFDDKSIAASALHQLLWSAAGVVRAQHPRIGSVMPQRTLASAGGMHLLTVYVALRRPVGDHAPGVYRVDYPGEKLIALELVNDQLHDLPLAFSKPWQLHYATGAIFVVADPAVGALRYRNRSLQYLFMEAGAALHNVALSAQALGVGQATLGGYYEQAASRLCGLSNELVMGSAIFGAQATAEQIAAVARSPEIDFAWVNGDSARYSMGFYLARAKVKTQDDERAPTWGRDTDPWLAMRKAIAEAIEREGYREPRDIENGTLGEIENALDPRECIRYSQAQYQQPGFPYQKFDPTQPYAWVRAKNLVSGQTVRVLAELVYSRDSLAAQGHEVRRPVTQVTSSGCAAGVSLQDATERALREVIERDAFMRHWLRQRPGAVVPPEQWPAAIAQRMQAMQEAGCRVSLQQLEVPWMHVAVVAAQHDGQHFTTLGMAASHSFLQATEGALDEAESRVYAWVHGHAVSIADGEQVQTTEHHFELYGLKRYYRRADRVLFAAQARATECWPVDVQAKNLDEMVRSLAQSDLQPLVVDITPKEHCVDQGRTPLSVVKVLVPGLLPISFGYQREPLGMVRKAHAAARVPHPFP